MSIYRRKTSSGRKSRFFTAEFQFRGRVYRKNGFADRDSAKHWAMEESLKMRRGSTGYVKPMLAAQVTPLIDQFVQHLLTRGRDEHYAYIMGQRLARLSGQCGWLTLGNLNRPSLETWANSSPKYRGKKIGGRTINQFIDSARDFGKWLASSKVAKLPSNPFADVEKVQSKHNDEYRRAATLDEIQRLLSTCPANRRRYYIFRLYCPLRSSTIAGLTWKMLRLDGTPPWIEIPAELNKSGRPERSPLRYDVAAELRKVKHKANDLVFPDPPTLDQFRADLTAAEIPLDDGKGNRRLDYHAMRKTLIRLCRAAGVPIDQASLLLHHKDVRTTQRHYDDNAVAPELGEAVEKLPTLGGMRRAQ